METKKRTQAADIAEIATKLDGKVNFSSIVYSQQMLSEKYRETCAKVVDVSKKILEMRFALRKQEKIKAVFGDETLTRIKESLTRYFSADRSEFPEGFRDIESDYNQLPGEPYPTIAINDAGNPERMIEFYVTGKQYDVYHVAFKGFIKG